MLLSVLGSGSRGNAVYVSSNGTAILIDAGLSLKQLKKRTENKGLDINTVAAIFVTHEHTDHWIGAFRLAAELDIYVYIDRVQVDVIKNHYAHRNWCKFAYIDDKHKQYVKTVQSYPFIYGPLSIDRFEVSHDTTLNKGFIIEDDTSKVGITTDLGYMSKGIFNKLKDCDFLVVESNHDLNMLRHGEYPLHIKDRVESNKGHLSNKQCAFFVSKLDPAKTKAVVLGHVSQDNNTDEKIIETFNETLVGDSPLLQIATQDGGSDVFYI